MTFQRVDEIGDLDPDDDPEQRREQILRELTSDNFDRWYDEWQYAQNIKEGKAFFNKPGYVKPPRRHSPSSLLECQRKVFYRNQNAPEEGDDPAGLFWQGEKFEEEIVMQFLEEAADEANPANYVQNSMWVDFEIETRVGDLQIKGETDPVVCDSEANPILVTEVKNKSSLDKFDEENPDPDPKHKAQVHCYMYGLTKSFERTINTSVIIYGDRTTHDLLPIQVDFDIEFWEDQVLNWAATQTEFRLDDELPPGEPSYSWECKFCDYSKRCGKGSEPGWYNGADDKYADDADWRDVGVDGFVPLTQYPQSKVVNYLRAHAAEGAKLTPTLADQHPELTDKFDIYPWTCPSCENEYPYGTFGWKGDIQNPPWCPNCDEDTLRGPAPHEQHE